MIRANYTISPKRDYLNRYRIDLIFYQLIHILILNVFSYLRFTQCTHKNGAKLFLFAFEISHRLPCGVSWVSRQYDTCIPRQYVIDSFFWRLFLLLTQVRHLSMLNLIFTIKTWSSLHYIFKFFVNLVGIRIPSCCNRIF